MNGKLNLKRTIEFASPQYLPVDIIELFPTEFIKEKDPQKLDKIRELNGSLKKETIDLWIYGHKITDYKKVEQRATWLDEWKTGWEDDGHGMKSVVFPLEESYEKLKDYKFPQAEFNPHEMFKGELSKYDGSTYLRGYIWFTLFERLWMLRGFENMLVDPYTDYDNFEYLRDKVLDFILIRIDEWHKLKVDGIYFSDDWGTQRGLLMNPDDWRKYYKPAYKKMFQKVRDNGMHVWMHLCGNIQEILPDLIDMGLSVLNPIQPQAMNINELAKNFGGKVCFNGGVDVQGNLIYGSPDDVKREVYNVVEVLGKYNGGYIGNTSHTIMPETPLDNIIALFEAFLDIQKK